ncbi:MAG TPA: 16S rRNA (adenine(1518)-N(6)/adenine(1519)-N(6))-dimethyltransferase RsmA [Candidatus Eisenbacteria bacterium]
MPPLEASFDSSRAKRARRPAAGSGESAATSGVPGTLRALGVRPSRRMGQSFLIDPRVAGRIAALASDPREAVVEIGPGLGALSEILAATGRPFVAVELDLRLADHVAALLSGRANARVVRGDVLDQRLADLMPGEGAVTVVANLPYSITTPAVAWVLAQGPRVRRAFLMMQREVAQRMTASPGGREFGSLSVFVALHAEAVERFRVSPGAFYPRPDVDSVVVEVTPRPFPGTTEATRRDAERLARLATGGRRKTMANALARGLGLPAAAVRSLLIDAGIDPVRRGETLAPEEWIGLARAWRRRGAPEGSA